MEPEVGPDGKTYGEKNPNALASATVTATGSERPGRLSCASPAARGLLYFSASVCAGRSTRWVNDLVQGSQDDNKAAISQ